MGVYLPDLGSASGAIEAMPRLSMKRSGCHEAHVIAFLKSECETFPDAREDLFETFTDGTMVAARRRFRGTHLGPMWLHAPTGRVMEATYIALYRVAGGKIAEAWAERDNLSGLRQLGLAPGSTPMESTP